VFFNRVFVLLYVSNLGEFIHIKRTFVIWTQNKKMADNEEDKNLKRCLEASIAVVQETIDRLKPQGQLQQEDSLINTILDVSIHSFTLDTTEEALMSNFKTDLENAVNDSLPSLSKGCRKYLLDFLCEYNYNYETREFTTPFNIGILDTFARDFQSVLASIDEFRAAWDGDKQKVLEFIKKYPTVKDTSGLWGITLLYSAARNNHFDLVKNLITKPSPTHIHTKFAMDKMPLYLNKKQSIIEMASGK
jgi:hypothetical protein